jgi:hypothetical protein
VQRWDVVKWGVAVNAGLATVAATWGHEHNVTAVLFWLAFAVSIGSLLLVLHYNRRITGAREMATILTKRLKSSYAIDYDDIVNINVAIAYSPGDYYDCLELLIFSAILVVSPFLALLKDIVSAPTITDSEAHAICWFLAALSATVLSAMLGCLSSLAQVYGAKNTDTFLCRHAAKIRWFALSLAIISVALFVYAAIVAVSATLHP